MHNLPIYKRIYYRYLGFVYGFTCWTSRRSFLGFRIRTLVLAAAFAPLALAWRQNRSGIILGLAALLELWVLFLYWRARRVGYKKFVAGGTAVTLPDDLNPLPPNQRVPLRASGIFGVSSREEQLLMCPAVYWRVPLGDHTIMAQPAPGRFLYQFFSATTLQNIQRGWLIHGLTPQSVLVVTFLTSWGAEPLSLRALYQGGDEMNQKQRIVYLYFDDKNDERAVWHTIMHDAREKRKA